MNNPHQKRCCHKNTTARIVILFLISVLSRLVSSDKIGDTWPQGTVEPIMPVGTLPASFYPAGTNAGDTMVPVSDDGSSEEILLATSFPFFDMLYKKLYVSMDILLILFILPAKDLRTISLPNSVNTYSNKTFTHCMNKCFTMP